MMTTNSGKNSSSYGNEEVWNADLVPARPIAETVIVDETPTESTALIVDTILQETEIKGPSFQDVPFAFLFLIHLAIMIYLGVFRAPLGYQELQQLNFTALEDGIRDGDDITEEDIQKFKEFASETAQYFKVYSARIYAFLVVPSLLLAFIISFLSVFLVIKPCPRTIVYTCLVGTVAWTAFILLLGTMASGAPLPASIGILAIGLASVCYYVKIAWSMVPFAAVNLKGALNGISRNWGIYLIAFLFAKLGFFWVIYWLYVIVGVSSYKDHECMAAHPNSNFDMTSENYDDVCDPPAPLFLLFLLSLYWTNAVFMNTIQVTVSGVMATWCFVSEDAENCCSPAVFGSLLRSLSYSFGSICLGSLLQGLVAVLRYMVENARNRGNQNDNLCGTLCLCILECLLRLVEDLLLYFNQWAYCFVGIYGLSYIESGKRVVELFRARGWTSIVSNNLAGYVLEFTTFCVAIVTGCMALVVEHIVTKRMLGMGSDESYVFGPVEGYQYWTFGIGFIAGLWVCSIMMNVVKGAVNTLIICWADSPAKMETQHPDLTAEMAQCWQSVYPDAILSTSVQQPQPYNAQIV